MKLTYIFTVLFFLSLVSSYAQNSELDIIKAYLLEQGLNSNDINDLKIKSSSYSNSLNVKNIYVIQQYEGIPIRNAIGSFALKDGKVVFGSEKYIHSVHSKINSKEYSISPENAIRKAAQFLELGGISTPILLNESIDKRENEFSNCSISKNNIPVKLFFEYNDDQLILCWDLNILCIKSNHWYSVRINAKDGSLQSKNNWAKPCRFNSHTDRKHQARKKVTTSEGLKPKLVNMMNSPSYRVFQIPFIESPNHGNHGVVTNQEDIQASPFGWHDTNGVVGAEHTTTRGNNVIAYEDSNGNNSIGYMPEGGPNLNFEFSYDENATVGENEDAAITNLFYVSNVIHDIAYQYGFDESSGNFQFNNYGKGGFGSDEVLAEAIDGSDINNAIFSTPPDGLNPRMSMFLWNPEPIPGLQLFTINNSVLAGSYDIVDNAFDLGHVDAPEAPDALTADLELVEDNVDDVHDACSSLINASDLTNKIAVVRRGTCLFIEKVLVCQQAGALAVIVVNNDGGNAIPMGGSEPQINIPAVMINMTDGEQIISQLQSGTNLNVSLSDRGKQFFARDGSFDNGIIIHEYVHGITSRLTGGAFTVDCLTNDEQMGEGWSDWFGLMLTMKPSDQGADSRGIGTYVISQPTTGLGIRPFYYSTNMSVNPVTYADVADDASFAIPHGVGFIWGSMIWDLAWAFIERDGFDPDLYNGTGGNNLVMQLVMDGLKLQGCNPGFVDARDGILAAAELLPNATDNKCLIWEVFARRGLGFSASQGSSNQRDDQIEAFDIPVQVQLDCEQLSVNNPLYSAFKIYPSPSSGSFTIQTPKELGSTDIYIYDLQGRKVYEESLLLQKYHNIELDIASGIYILKIESKKKNVFFDSKIMIE